MGPRDHIRRKAEENRRIRHRIAHELRKELVRVDDRELSSRLGGLEIDSFSLQSRAKGVPVCARRDKNDALAIGNGGAREAADCAIEELLILIQLDDVIAWARTGQKAAPRFALIRGLWRW